MYEGEGREASSRGRLAQPAGTAPPRVCVSEGDRWGSLRLSYPSPLASVSRAVSGELPHLTV